MSDDTCAAKLGKVYALAIVAADRFGVMFGRSHLLETRFPIATAELTHDDPLNERSHYEQLFSEDCRAFVENLHADLMKRMKGTPFGGCEEEIAALKMLQHIVAVGLWKYRCDVGDGLADFAREFDRLDVDAERQRLYQQAQT